MIGCPFRKLHRTCIHIMQPRLGQSGIIEIGQVAARAIWHHRAMLESQAGAPPHSPEAVHSRLRVAQVVSDCCVWRFVYPKRLLLWQARSRATCRLSTFLLSFMIFPIKHCESLPAESGGSCRDSAFFCS